ncbi:GIY-YIG nuclease family protein [Pseudomaricurvus sp.]|uniref:GIY-YIG nuclease family protein n=1 Tax=Pseudomaricurvus sp. TaxID=2004510 RepID=UPI003F6C3F8C
MPDNITDNLTNNATTHWCVYIILSSDNRLYTGITTDIEKRWHAHCNTQQGAKFFRGRSPKQLLYIESGFDRSSASQREAAIKKLNRAQKLVLIKQQSETNWHDQLNLPQS